MEKYISHLQRIKTTKPPVEDNAQHFSIKYIPKKIGIKASTKCDLCEEEDYTEHKFYQCQSVKPLWDLIESLIQIRFKQDFKITEEIAMLGYIGGNEKIRKKINTTILIAKLCIQKFRFGTIKNLLEIWEKEFTVRKI